MTNRFTGPGTALAHSRARQSLTWTSVSKTARALLTTAQHTLTIFGLSAAALMVLLLARPDLARYTTQFFLPAPNEAAAAPGFSVAESADGASGLSVAESADRATGQAGAAPPPTREQQALLGNKKQQAFVTSWLSKRYRVAGNAADMLVSTAYLTAHDIKLDPLLILAVMAIESGLNPFAESPVGAQGLMQVMSKVHHDKFEDMGGVQAALNPVANIRVGSLILKDYVTRGGSVEAGLKTYVGASAFDTDAGYGSRVLAEYDKLKQVAIGKKVPISSPAPVLAEKKAEPKVEPVVPSAHEQIAGL